MVVPLDLLDLPDVLVTPALLDHPVLLAHRAHRVFTDFRAFTALLVRLVRLVLLAVLVALVVLAAVGMVGVVVVVVVVVVAVLGVLVLLLALLPLLPPPPDRHETAHLMWRCLTPLKMLSLGPLLLIHQLNHQPFYSLLNITILL
jgi:hypothetical protein